MSGKNLQEYWKKNLGYVAILLAIWFLVSYVFGIFLADSLNAVRDETMAIDYSWAH